MDQYLIIRGGSKMSQNDDQIDITIVTLLKHEVLKIERDNELAVHKKTSEEKATEIFNLIKARVKR